MQLSIRTLAGFLSLLMIVGAGCVSTPDALTPPMGANKSPGNENLETQTAERELESALRMLTAGQYSLAIPRLMLVTSKFPDSPAATDAYYQLGVTYHAIGGLRDARDNFRKYLRLAPQGKYAESTGQYLASLTDEAIQRNQVPEVLDSQIAAVEAAAISGPLQLAQRLELADLYWKKGEYARAGALYQEILGDFPQLEKDATVRTRLEKQPNGDFVLLTPDEVVNRTQEAEPLSIFNTNAFRSGRFQGVPATSNERFYTVTGQVVNRGSKQLVDVQINVTIYGFGTMIYDTQTIAIGSLQPDQTQAFSARFGNFDNIDNIDRFECVGSFRRQG